ncbi:MAG: replication-associated recombination protein A [Bacillota bacterium]|nr:replication-associated recombination protein A [Bacillota bacterium]
MGEAFRSANAPLADRMRPQSLEEFVGQEAVIGPGRLLRRAIEAGRVPSLLLWGPPGSGKTTLARLIARSTRAAFVQLSAVSAGVADLRQVVAEARERQRMEQRKTILFIDEIHRFNKAQQDAILPYVEDGTLTLIGATTENPYFEVIAPLLSRLRLFRLQPLGEGELRTLLRRALADPERGLGRTRAEVDEAALDHLVRMAAGDARTALNALELAVLSTEPGPDGVRHVTLEAAEESIQAKALRYDRLGDEHYDTASAFIKSMRGSDPDAALYWMARMIEAGEDPRFIARRLVIHAAEDVGLADPMALVVAASAFQAAELVGWPEGRIPLAEAVLYVATAPKSNSVVRAIDAAQRSVREAPAGGVPLHLRSSGYRGAARLGHGEGYRYPHDDPRGFVEQQYLPDGVQGGFYEPGKRGYEREVARRLAGWWPKRWPGEPGAAGGGEAGGGQGTGSGSGSAG